MQEPIYRFGEFELSPRERVLRWQGELVPLPPKAFATLLVLVEAEGRVVNKAELLEAVWPGTFVSEANLPQTVSVLRRGFAQGFPDSDPIETVARVGYMFRASVQIQFTREPLPVKVPEPEPSPAVPGTGAPMDTPASGPVVFSGSERKPGVISGRIVWIATVTVAMTLLLAAFAWSHRARSGFFAADLKLVPLTSGAGWEADPAISPDGKLLAYVSRKPGEAAYSVWVKPVFGLEGAKCVLRQGKNAFFPAWSPDGKRLAFMSEELGGVAVLELASGSVRLAKPRPFFDEI